MIYTLDGIAPTIGQGVWVAPDANVIGKIVLEDGANVWFGATLRGDNEVVHVGRGTNIQEDVVCHTDMGFPLTIGADCTIGHKAMLHGCTIGDNTLVGIQSVILNNARIGRNSIVGAGTLIPEGKTYPDGVLIVGVPGKVVRELTPEQIERLKLQAAHYVQQAERHRTQVRRID